MTGMKWPVFYSTSVVVVALGVIVVSTVTLSILSYKYTVGRESLVETTLTQGYVNLTRQTVDRIEQKIIDNDRILVEMADVEDRERWPAIADAIKKADLNVEQVYFMRLDSNYPLYPPYSDDIRNSWGAMRASYRELKLDELAFNQPHHLHKERPDNYFFMTYVMKQNSNGQKFLVCFQMNIERIVTLLDYYLRPLLPTCYVAVVDFDNNGVYVEPMPRSGKYYNEMRFPTTLYKWIIQVVPRNYTELERDIRFARRTNLVFIVLSMSLTFGSLAIIFLAGRRERQLRRLKEDFISNVSHELKTPLSLIRMFNEILMSGKARNEEARQEYRKIIQNESERMTRLIANLLDFASLDRDKKNKHFEMTDIGKLVEKELEAYRYQIQKDGFQLNAEIESGLPQTFADANALTMALFNLLDNSVKYSGDGREISVKVRQVDGHIDLSVTDRGIGIPEKERAKIFDKFFRGSQEEVRKTRGSGIGLALTRSVATMHGGEVSVESSPGNGSTFTMSIPIRTSGTADTL
jgi:two-component system, OmpR family, phosphate regulon sensor histidine kinase PhoR